MEKSHSMRKSKTLFRQLIRVTCFMIIPVLFLLAFYNYNNREKLRNELILSYQNETELKSAKVGVWFEMLNSNLKSFPSKNLELRTIVESKKKDNAFWISNSYLSNSLKNFSSASVEKYVPFIYIPHQDMFYNYLENHELSDEIRERISQSDGYDYDRWFTIQAGNNSYFVRILNYDRYYIGAWISFEELFYFLNIENSEEDFYSFCEEFISSEEKVCLGAKVLYSNQNLCRHISEEKIEDQLPGITDGFLWILITVFLVFVVYIYLIHRVLIKPVAKITKSVEEIPETEVNYSIAFPEYGSTEILLMTQKFNELLEQIQRHKTKLYEEELERQEIELQYLSSQIQPHFILNTLNTLYNYNESDTETAQEMIRLITRYYRYVINVNSKYVQIGEELKHIKNYLDLQMIRYPKAFAYEINCEEALEITPIPPFLLESFISNVIKYARTPGEMIHLKISVEEIQKFHIRIRISDTGPGFSEDMLDILEEYVHTGEAEDLTGIGIKNSIQRLKLIYQDRSKIKFYNQQPHGAVVEMEIILNTHKQSPSSKA